MKGLLSLYLCWYENRFYLDSLQEIISLCPIVLSCYDFENDEEDDDAEFTEDSLNYSQIKFFIRIRPIGFFVCLLKE